VSEGNYVSGGRSLYGGLFEEWEMSVARNTVIKFKAKYPWLRFPETDDLLQECLTQWYFTRGRFQQGRGASIKTYMSKVVSVRLRAILREQLSHKRRLNQLACSLDEPLGESGETLADVIAADQTLPDLALLVDVQTVLRELVPLQQSICRLLGQGYPVKRIAEVLGKPRTTVRDQIKRIREVFSRRGFAD
jgi:RNA polymerase sigma factor (sigma-70 family)